MSRASHTPKYRRQRNKKGKDFAFVELDHVRFYLGPYDSPKSRQLYHQRVQEWEARGRQLLIPAELLTLNELAARFLIWADSYYRKPDGSVTTEYSNHHRALEVLLQTCGNLKVTEFGPLKLKIVRTAMVTLGWQRQSINRQIGRLKHVFKWGVEEELVEPDVYLKLKAVAGLKRGRTEAKESYPVRPVSDEHIEAVRPHVYGPVWSLIQLQLLTAARAGELVIIRAGQIDRTGRIWLYQPEEHKTAHHEHDRLIYLGPQAQEILSPLLLKKSAGEYLFTPEDTIKERSSRAKTHRRPGQLPSPRKTTRILTEHYQTSAYRRTISRACDAAGIPKWCPHQLRHTAGTRIRKEFGLEAARVILGHKSIITSEIYAELDKTRAEDAISKIG